MCFFVCVGGQHLCVVSLREPQTEARGLKPEGEPARGKEERVFAAAAGADTPETMEPLCQVPELSYRCISRPSSLLWALSLRHQIRSSIRCFDAFRTIAGEARGEDARVCLPLLLPRRLSIHLPPEPSSPSLPPLPFFSGRYSPPFPLAPMPA